MMTIYFVKTCSAKGRTPTKDKPLGKRALPPKGEVALGISIKMAEEVVLKLFASKGSDNRAARRSAGELPGVDARTPPFPIGELLLLLLLLS